MLLDLLKPFLGFSAHLPHPGSRSILQFGMIFILPCSVGGSQCNMLLARRWISSRLVGHGNTRFVGHGHGLDRGAPLPSQPGV